MKTNIFYIVFSTIVVFVFVCISKYMCDYCEEETFVPTTQKRIPLSYNTEIENVETVDALFSIFLRLIDAEDCRSSDYWDWETKVSAAFDSICDKRGLFVATEYKSRYEQVMDAIDRYVWIGPDMTQHDMHVDADVNYMFGLYKMMRMVKQLDTDMVDIAGINIHREHSLYMRYRHMADEWEFQIALADGAVGTAYPAESIRESLARFEKRMADFEEMFEAMSLGDGFWEYYPRDEGKRPAIATIKTYFHKMMPWSLIPARYPDEPEPEFPTDTLGQKFLEWIDYRDSIAEEMPSYLKIPYRRQTADIINNTII